VNINNSNMRKCLWQKKQESREQNAQPENKGGGGDAN
jgi:hypothetical protein